MAGRIPQSFIDELVGRADIVEIIDARVPLKKAGREYKACCPFHDEKSPSFTVSPQKQFFHCFGCGAHGTVLGFLMDYEHMDFVEVIEDLAARYGLEVPREGADAAPDEATRDHSRALLDLLDKANGLFKRWLREHPEARAATDYLKGRGMSGRTAADFELGYAPPGWDNLLSALGADNEAVTLLADAGLLSEAEGGHRRYDRFRNRIMFPIHDRRGQVVGFGARTLGDDTPKYLNSPETPVFHKGRELYALNRVQRLRERPEAVLVVEGYMDVVMLAEHGIHYACAALGTAATPEQMERLFRVTPDVVFCFDGDPAGRRAAWRALENALPFMRDGRSARFIFLPEGEDPDSYVRSQGADAFEALMARAPTLTGFLFDTLRNRTDTGTAEGQAKLKEEARPLIERLPDGTLKTLATQRLSELIGLSLDRTEGELGLRRQGGPRIELPPHATGGAPGVASPARRAITLLVHFPRLAATAGDVRDLASLEIRGAELLSEILETLKALPDLTTAGLLEHFRDHPHGGALMRIASGDPPPAGDALEAELLGCLARVRLEPGEARFQALRERVREGIASEAEQREYAMLAQGQASRPR